MYGADVLQGFNMADLQEDRIEELENTIGFEDEDEAKAVIPEASSKQLDGLDAYLQKIRKYPILSQPDEYEAISRWQSHRDSKALQKVTNSHLRLAATVAAKYLGYGLPFDDLISEATVGMIKAVDRFDIKREVRFSTYAIWWMHANIKEYVLNMWSSVRLGSNSTQRKLFFQLRRIKENLRNSDENEIPDDYIQQISEKTGTSYKDVYNMSLRLGGQDYSLNTTLSDEDGSEWQDILEDEIPNQEDQMIDGNMNAKRSELLKLALESLNEREYVIFYRRQLTENPPTLQNLSTELSISRERIRQIEERALSKVIKMVKNKAIEQRIISY